MYLEPNEYRQIVVTFVSNGAPGVTVEMPQTAMDIYDPINDDTINFQSNSNNFTTRFPVDIYAHTPTNASIGDNIVVPINITNLLTDSTFSGSIILELVNSEGVSVYNSTTVITLAPSETQELELVASPEIDPGVYIIKGTLQGTEASMSIFEEYISIDAGYVLGFVHLQNQYNHKGTEVKLGNYNATTLPDGSYLFEGIPIGIYPLNLTHSGYLDYNGEVKVNEGFNTIPQITLVDITSPRLCGDVAPCPDCDGTVDMGDVILLLNNVSYPENTRYVLGNDWAGDCRCTGVRDMGDVILLLNNVSYLEESRYALDCCD